MSATLIRLISYLALIPSHRTEKRFAPLPGPSSEISKAVSRPVWEGFGGTPVKIPT